ncbi:MAG: NAD(P)-binding domain-containing protein [Cytophagales bacterium]|nr:NAD(P)-binding domain-containing protein [Cytophagales bacterium]
MNVLDVIVVGAGHAGLSASYYLKQSGLSHLVLERGRVGESWLSQRWDSFRMNTSNKLNTLPGDPLPPAEADGFGSAASLAARMRDFAAAHSLPVLEHTPVLSVAKDPHSGEFLVEAASDGMARSFCCRKVIIASGGQSEKQASPLASRVAPGVQQLHSSEYRNPEGLPPGGVLIVGSGQSGCQIAEDLVGAGRNVYLSTSRVPRCPRRYRGKDIMDWLVLTGFFNTRPEEIDDPAMLHLRTPLLKGTDGGRTTLSLQALAEQGVVLLGKLHGADGPLLSFGNDAAANVAFADAFSGRVKAMIDAFIAQHELDAPPAGADPADAPATLPDCSESALSLDLESRGISTVIWANGFRASFDYLKLPVFDAAGNIAHRQCLAET